MGIIILHFLIYIRLTTSYKLCIGIEENRYVHNSHHPEQYSQFDCVYYVGVCIQCETSFGPYLFVLNAVLPLFVCILYSAVLCCAVLLLLILTVLSLAERYTLCYVGDVFLCARKSIFHIIRLNHHPHCLQTKYNDKSK